MLLSAWKKSTCLALCTWVYFSASRSYVYFESTAFLFAWSEHEGIKQVFFFGSMTGVENFCVGRDVSTPYRIPSSFFEIPIKPFPFSWHWNWKRRGRVGSWLWQVVTKEVRTPCCGCCDGWEELQISLQEPGCMLLRQALNSVRFLFNTQKSKSITGIVLLLSFFICCRC